MKTLIKGGHVIDPSLKLNAIADVLIENGKIAKIDERIKSSDADRTIEADGMIVTPGLVDIHTHLREPGFEDKETIATGTAAAARGGVTSILCMANTNPVTDTPERFSDMLRRIEKDAVVNVYPAAAVSLGLKGEEVTEIELLHNLGAVALSDDGVPLGSAAVLRKAMRRAAKCGIPILSHCENGDMVNAGVMNEGKLSEELGLPGRPAVAEEIDIVRDGMLAADTGAHVHICHVSTKGSVKAIRALKSQGVNITAETCPQYFSLTEDEIKAKGTMAKVNPPLRRAADVEAIAAALADGTLDAIVTDHAPHTAAEKANEMRRAPSGMVGLETSLAVTLTYLHHGRGFSLDKIIDLMSCTPAKILGIPKGTLRPGADADIVIFDPDSKWTVNAEKFASKGRNTPFDGAKLAGKVRCTIVGGNIVFEK